MLSGDAFGMSAAALGMDPSIMLEALQKRVHISPRWLRFIEFLYALDSEGADDDSQVNRSSTLQDLTTR